MTTADLLIDSAGPEIRHRSGLHAADSFIYLKPEKQNGIVLFSALEYEKQAAILHTLQNGVEIKHLEPYLERTRENTSDLDGTAKLLSAVCTKHALKNVRISGNMPYRLVQALESIAIPYEVYNFANERLQKSGTEIEHLRAAQKVVEMGFDLVQSILKASQIQGDHILYKNEILTSEVLKTEVEILFLQQGYSCPAGMIIASREQSACPHHEGNGPIYANEAIVVDLFPRCTTTGYYADMTRTFVKGTPSSELQKQYEAVLAAQTSTIERMTIGVFCKDIHTFCKEEFINRGFATTNEEGFTHSIGHGVGLELHEAPRFGNADITLAAGMAVTVEPGLYYKAVGGVRIEDVVVFHSDGTKENLNTYPKDEWIIA